MCAGVLGSSRRVPGWRPRIFSSGTMGVGLTAGERLGAGWRRTRPGLRARGEAAAAADRRVGGGWTRAGLSGAAAPGLATPRVGAALAGGGGP